MLYITSHKFAINNNGVFTTGSQTDELFSRYEAIFGKVDIFGCYISSNKYDKERLKLHGKSVYLFRRRNLFGINKIKTLIKLIKQNDYIFIKSGDVNGFIASIICRVFGKKYFIEVIGCPFDAFVYHSFIGKLIAPIEFFIARSQIWYASYAIYVTNKFLQKRYPTKGASIACSDVFLKEINIDSSIKRRFERIAVSKKRIVIGTAGSVAVKYKGQHKIIKAIKIVKERGINSFVYQLAGGGDNSRLKKLAQSLGVEENVEFLGMLDHDEMFDWYDSLDIYMQPSETEGMPRALIEAMSRGLLCFASDVGGIPELLDGEHLLKKPVSAKAIAEKLFTLEKEDFIDVVVPNIQTAKMYEKHQLDARRNEFYNRYRMGK